MHQPPHTHQSLCRTLSRCPANNKPAWPSLLEGSQGGHCGWATGGAQAGPLRGRRPGVVKDSPVTGDHPWVTPAEGAWTLRVAQPGPMPGPQAALGKCLLN